MARPRGTPNASAGWSLWSISSARLRIASALQNPGEQSNHSGEGRKRIRLFAKGQRAIPLAKRRMSASQVEYREHHGRIEFQNLAVSLGSVLGAASRGEI